MAKITDVAALAGVSVGAVSRVLSGDPTLRVGEATRRKIVEAAEQLEYVPSHAARALRTSRARTLALVVPDLTSAVFAELTAGAEDQAAARGLTIVLARAERLATDSTWLQRVVGEGRIDGVVLQVPDAAPQEAIANMSRHNLPVVLINSIADGPLDTVVLDDEAGIATAVDHLVGLGHRSIGLIGGTPGSATGMRRRRGFTASLIRHGLAVPGSTAPATWITSLGYTGAEGRAAGAELLTSATLPTALVVANLNAALGVLAEIHTRSLRVPGDISVIALHDVWYADATWPPITTVRMPLRELGSAAVSMLVDKRPDRAAQHVVMSELPPTVILRASTAAPRYGSLSAGR